MNLKTYIQNKEVNHFTFKGVEVFVKDTITNNISMKQVMTTVDKILPSFVFRGLDSVYVGNFDFLNKRSVQAMYENSSIFITNIQDDVDDMVDDIVHEISHFVEDNYGNFLYSDQKIQQEFIRKRKRLWMVLDKAGYDVDLDDFLKIDFSFEFDDFLYKKIGYSALSMISKNIFYSPYAATSLREYFANGFEAFFTKGDIDRLKKISPKIYLKIIDFLSTYGK